MQISTKHHPIKKIMPRILNLLKILKKRLNKLKHTKIRVTKMITIKIITINEIILLPKITSQVQVTTKIILMKN